MEKIRKIYIDCGAWIGDSIIIFKQYHHDYEIYGFECDPRLQVELKKLSKQYNFTFINKAIWIKNEKINLYPGIKNLTQSSSLYQEKKKYIDKKNPIKIDAIDFSTWIIKNFKINDLIICKMNIEGAEYDVLEKMIKDNSIAYIDKLYISWHWKKLKGFSKERHLKIKKEIKEKTKVLKW